MNDHVGRAGVPEAQRPASRPLFPTDTNQKERTKMKIAVTASGPNLNSPVDPRFGRAACFIIYDTETNTFESVDNTQNLNAAQGAGIQAAETVARQGVQSVITGHCGPKAFRVLSSAGIRIYTGAAGTVETAIREFSAGTLKEIQSADVGGHWV